MSERTAFRSEAARTRFELLWGLGFELVYIVSCALYVAYATVAPAYEWCRALFIAGVGLSFVIYLAALWLMLSRPSATKQQLDEAADRRHLQRVMDLAYISLGTLAGVAFLQAFVFLHSHQLDLLFPVLITICTVGSLVFAFLVDLFCCTPECFAWRDEDV